MQITGTVTLAPSGKRLKYATIKLIPAKADPEFQTLFTESDEDGNFAFAEDAVAKLKPGDYRLIAYHQYADQKKSLLFKLEENKPVDQDIELSGHPVSRGMGIVFVLFLIACLIGLLYYYHYRHQTHPKDRSIELLSLIDLTQQQLSIDTAEFRSELSRLKDSLSNIEEEGMNSDSFMHLARKTIQADTNAASRRTFRKFDRLYHSMKATMHTDTLIKGQIVHALIENFYQAANHQEQFNVLTAINEELSRKSERAFDLWRTPPWIYFEVLFWAMIATMIRLIIHNSNYTYYNKFRPFVIPRQIGFIVSIPVLALLITFLLSLIHFEIVGDAFTLKIDMSNVFIAIVIASIIGFAPFKAWDFLGSLADGFFSRLIKYFKKINVISSKSKKKEDGEDAENGQGNGDEPSDSDSDEDEEAADETEQPDTDEPTNT